MIMAPKTEATIKRNIAWKFQQTEVFKEHITIKKIPTISSPKASNWNLSAMT